MWEIEIAYVVVKNFVKERKDVLALDAPWISIAQFSENEIAQANAS